MFTYQLMVTRKSMIHRRSLQLQHLAWAIDHWLKTQAVEAGYSIHAMNGWGKIDFFNRTHHVNTTPKTPSHGFISKLFFSVTKPEAYTVTTPNTGIVLIRVRLICPSFISFDALQNGFEIYRVKLHI